MCGIAGFATTEPGLVSADDLRAMSQAVAHRGPDDDGLWLGDGVGLAHRRLAVLDLTPAGHQPMKGPRGARVSYNGEIYNFREIAHDLEQKGFRIHTRCDTEVLLLALEAWGLGALDRFNGMFAFGYWDPSTRSMTLVRDRLGVKPLYYYADHRCLVFASELRALERWSGCPRDIDPEALDLYLSYEYVPSPWSMRAGVRKLEPGCLVQWQDGRLTQRRWWDVTFTEPAAPRATVEYADECRELLRRATDRRLISDAPLGALLSGGVDSSAIVGFMAELGNVPRTFSIGFSDSSYNELDHARLVARQVGADHTDEMLRADPVVALDAVDRATDEPLADTSLIATYLVSAMARRDVTVVLSGDGGDEVFAGYDWYRAAHLASGYDRAPALLRRAVAAALDRVRPRPEKKGLVNKAKRFAEGAAGDPVLQHLRWQLFAASETKRSLVGPRLREEAVAGRAEEQGRQLLSAAQATTPLSRQQWADLRQYLPDDINVKVDRASMAVALETRSPFLDVDLVEWAATVPAVARFDGRVGKKVLRSAVDPLVPASVLERPKEGFSVPVKQWLRDEWRPLAESTLQSATAAEWFDPGACRALLDEHVAGRRNHAHLLWTLIVFLRWAERPG